MHESEGVIKYQIQHTTCNLPKAIDISQMNAWRSLLFDLKLIGQCAEKYAGLGYGNFSQRLMAESAEFLISGTQTGHLPKLNRTHFAIVETASLLQNTIKSYGPSQPSSEALTHASVYLQDSQVNAVIHVHCPVIWHCADRLSLPYTKADIAYGSVEMADAVGKLFSTGLFEDLPLFCMLGHEDGVVAFGYDVESAAVTLITQLARAMAIEETTQDS